MIILCRARGSSLETSLEERAGELARRLQPRACVPWSRAGRAPQAEELRGADGVQQPAGADTRRRHEETRGEDLVLSKGRAAATWSDLRPRGRVPQLLLVTPREICWNWSDGGRQTASPHATLWAVAGGHTVQGLSPV